MMEEQKLICVECHGEGCPLCGNKGFIHPDEPTLEDVKGDE